MNCRNCGHDRHDHLNHTGGWSASFIPSACLWKTCACEEYADE